MSGLRVFLVSLTLALTAACGGPSPEELQKQAQAALDGGDFTGALGQAEKALQEPGISGDPVKAWRFESIRLDALARAGKAEDVKTHLERLEKTYATQVTAALYRSLADKVRVAGDTMGAIDLLAAGDRKFPAEHESFVKAIDEIKAAGLDPATEEMLKKLGYL